MGMATEQQLCGLRNALAGWILLSALPICAASTNILGFDISWPITDPEVTNKTYRSLLMGELLATQTGGVLTVRITLTRPADEVHRALWNRTLYYREYEWMNTLRVWDVRRQWLYPNLAFLFTIHGEERVGRYGGWDRGHKNDNDFGGLLLRKYNAHGKESPSTKNHPLVTASWHPVTDQPFNQFTVLHQARSEDLSIRLNSPEGRADLWLVYGDFMNSPAPTSWPRAEEFCGNTLAFFQIFWKKHDPEEFQITLFLKRPLTGTGFDWEEWIDRYIQESKVKAQPVLSETP